MAFQDFDQISERRRNERMQKKRKRIMIAVFSVVFVVLLVAAAVVCFVIIKPSSASKSTKTDQQPDQKSRSSESAAVRAPPVEHSPPPPAVQSSPPAPAVEAPAPAPGADVEAPASAPAPAGVPAPSPAEEPDLQTEAIIKTLCSPTDYKEICESSLLDVVNLENISSAQPKDLLSAAISATATEIDKVINATSVLKFDNDPKLQAALDDCIVLLNDAKDELNASFSNVMEVKDSINGSAPDLNNWLSAVLSYQHTCIDGFPDGEQKSTLENSLNKSKELTSNALAFISDVSSAISSFQFKRRLLSGDRLPSWMNSADRRLLKAAGDVKLIPNVTVAKDGSGNYPTISAALAAMPPTYEGRYVIYIKEGVYEESVVVTKKMVNVTMIGDGSQKSIITGSKNFIDGVPTFETATFAALGDGFMAQSIGFRNTAGPEKHQAVALRVQADHAIFLNCRMEAYQDTLYAQTHRQFYRGCYITGTVDFIFGDASAIFQNCMIYLRKPMDNQQNIVTAQGRVDKRQNTGIVLQNCRILADPTLEPVKATIKSYLGRPWKEFSRTVVMETEISDAIHPDGWFPWNGDFALSTLYYAEFNNKGPGSDVASRVKWPGYRVINKDEALQFTVGPFIQGDAWLTNVDVPVHLGLSS